MAFIRDNHYTKWIFDESQVKVMREMACFMGARATILKLGALHGKSLEEAWKFVVGYSKHSIGLWVFSTAKLDILGKAYAVME